MTDVSHVSAEEAYVERVKLARHSGAVLKAKLISLRSDSPEAIVLAFEGDDDKIIYGQWIRRIRPELRYEPFPCGGKKELKGLKNALTRDLNRLDEKVFFFVDRDFDDLSGFDSVNAVFVTDMYSVENYLVSEIVLDGLLRDEFPCHGAPDKRNSIIERFRSDYDIFLEVTYSLNRRIFIARKVPIELKKRLPTSLRDIATVAIGNVEPVQVRVEDVVVCEREPTPEEISALGEQFNRLEPKARYRGKFALKFFRDWIGKLADDQKQDNSILFSGIEGSVRRAELVISNFASKSVMPEELGIFIRSI